jgi:hypothetical protein
MLTRLSPDLTPLVMVADCPRCALRSRRGGDGALRLARASRPASSTRRCGRSLRRQPRSGRIGPCCYEVGEEVLTAFAGLDGVATGRKLDLTAVATRLLEEAGVENVEQSGLCTSCNPELFYSHRRDGERTGRQAGLIWRSG